jgi:hypothetical protein
MAAGCFIKGGRCIRIERQKLEDVLMSTILKSATDSSISATKGEDEDLAPIQKVIDPVTPATRPTGTMIAMRKKVLSIRRLRSVAARHQLYLD